MKNINIATMKYPITVPPGPADDIMDALDMNNPLPMHDDRAISLT